MIKKIILSDSFCNLSIIFIIIYEIGKIADFIPQFYYQNEFGPFCSLLDKQYSQMWQFLTHL